MSSLPPAEAPGRTPHESRSQRTKGHVRVRFCQCYHRSTDVTEHRWPLGEGQIRGTSVLHPPASRKSLATRFARLTVEFPVAVGNREQVTGVGGKELPWGSPCPSLCSADRAMRAIGTLMSVKSGPSPRSLNSDQ